MTTRRILCFFFVIIGAAVFRGGVSAQAPETVMSEPGAASLPKSFLIARMPYTMAGIGGVVYNPKRDRYVVFIVVVHGEHLSRIYTRIYKPDGTPVSGPRQAFETDELIQSLRVAYSAKDDRFLGVAGISERYAPYNAIRACVFDGLGRLLPDEPSIVIKESGGMFSGLAPRADWVAETNQYIVTWSHWNPLKSSDPANGHYLSVLESDFSIKIDGRRVMQQACSREEPLYAPAVPFGERILWGGAELVGTNWVRPRAWFTDLKGKIQTEYGDNGFLYPGPMVKTEGRVMPVYDTDGGVALLHWNVADHRRYEKQTFNKNFVRILDGQGVFKSKTIALPKRTAFQGFAIAVPNSREGRFFLVAPEYRFLKRGDLYDYGMTLRGFFVNRRGRVEDKTGKERSVGYDLTPALLDPHKAAHLEALDFCPKDNSYFIGYAVGDEYNKYVDFMGIIYK